MSTAAGWSGPHAQDRSLVLNQFEKDMEFYQLFLLLINKSCPIKRVDVVWANDGPAVRVGLLQKTVCTEAALASRCADLIGIEDSEPHFCNLVNDYGRHQAESCAISDSAAEGRVRDTGTTSVYRCHAGLIDIAVPVICDGMHLATLLAGQALTEPKSEQKFVQIRESLSRLEYLDFSKLEADYWRVPEVSEADIQHTVAVLEIFAQHLAHTWKRLVELVRDQQQRDRELRLLRKEFAHALLDGNAPATGSMADFMQRIGLKRFPNRALVVSPESEASYGESGLPFQLAFSSTLEAVEQLCSSLPDVSFAYLHQRGFCVFFCDQEDAEDFYSLPARSLAEKILLAVTQASGLRARIGIGSAKPNWQSLIDSYQEACIALSETTGCISVYHKVPDTNVPLSVGILELCRFITDRKIPDARRALLALPVAVNRELNGGSDSLEARRRFFSFALTRITSVAADFGGSPPDPVELARGLASARTAMALQETFVSAGEQILRWIESIYAGQHERLVAMACRQIEKALRRTSTAQAININTIAASAGVSPAYLTRLFKRTTGVTFERYVMKARISAAQSLLLDPLVPVSAVAEKCGFQDAAYFTRVFREITGGSPTAYRQNPRRFLPSTADTAPASRRA